MQKRGDNTWAQVMAVEMMRGRFIQEIRDTVWRILSFIRYEK